jgi:hypothetical protein
MNFYQLGQREAAATYLKQADYADSIANAWEKVSPTKTPRAVDVASRVLGGVTGGALGGLGVDPESAGKFLEWNGRTGGGVMDAIKGLAKGGLNTALHNPLDPYVTGGTATGASLGGHIVGKAHKKIMHHGRSNAIRKMAPKVGKGAAGLGATALTALLAKHLLSDRDE